jgi:prepilin-type N-terminal cleavage/methylation domain-containing protein
MQEITTTSQLVQCSGSVSETRRGFSIIEVLVAISILTVGILAILILFPAGTATLQTAAEFTNASRLGQAELEKADASQTQMIAAIYPDPGLVPSTQNPTSLLSSVTSPMSNQTDVNAYRFIEGETVRVPAPRLDSNNQPVSLYTVVAAPIEANSLSVYGEPWKGTTGDSTNPALNVNAGYGSDLSPGEPQYLIDYATGEILLAPEATGTTPYAETIQITVTGSDGKPITQTLLAQLTPTSQIGTWVPLSSLAAVAPAVTAIEPPIPWVVGSDVLSRNFTCLNAGTPYQYSLWASNNSVPYDPYTYQLYEANMAGGNDPSNLGVIAFNPALGQMTDANGEPIRAMLNYNTYDWHIISEDRSVTSPKGSVKLSLTSLLSNTANDAEQDSGQNHSGTPFLGLFTLSGVPGTSDPDVIVLDMDTGAVLTEGDNADYTVNYSTGTIGFLNAPPNDHLRIFYHPAKDWAVALARSPIFYTQDTGDGNAPILAHFSILSQSATIYFPEADIGKEVDIRFSYTSSTVTTPMIEDGTYTIASVGTNTAGVSLDSTSNFGAAAVVGTNPVITPISIKGTSLSAIVIWKENGRWRNQTISTILPGQSNPSSTTLL